MEKRQHKQKAVLMTEGPIWRCLLLFALPLMAGNLFQQLYNTVDSIVVGNFVGKEALAAVGSTDSVINTFIGFFSGMSTGAGVIISQYYGGKKEEKVSIAVQTTIALTLCMSILCTVLALLLVPSLLRLMGTPDDVFPEAATYLRIYFIGVTGLLFYNMGAGILRAVGDSRRPLYFLIFCAVLNTLLDLLFVAVLRFGIAGAAWATILSQGISALLTLFVLTREKACYRIIWSKVRLDPNMTKKIFFLGLPAAIQMARPLSCSCCPAFWGPQPLCWSPLQKRSGAAFAMHWEKGLWGLPIISRCWKTQPFNWQPAIRYGFSAPVCRSSCCAAFFWPWACRRWPGNGMAGIPGAAKCSAPVSSFPWRSPWQAL